MSQDQLGWDWEVGTTKIEKTTKDKGPQFLTVDKSDYQRFFKSMGQTGGDITDTTLMVWIVIVNLRRAYGAARFELRPKNIPVEQITSRHVSKALAKLESRGLIKYTRTRGKTRVIEVLT